MSNIEDVQDIEFSDDEEVTWLDAKGYTMRFGKHKNKTLEEMIKTKTLRMALKYYLGWDDLREEARANIEVALAYYEGLKGSK